MIDKQNPVIEFSSHDRCDRCIQRAYAIASKGNLELMFCKHHIYQHNVALENDDWNVTFDFVGLGELYNIEIDVDEGIPA